MIVLVLGDAINEIGIVVIYDRSLKKSRWFLRWLGTLLLQRMPHVRVRHAEHAVQRLEFDFR
jgi:hypothetical protein